MDFLVCVWKRKHTLNPLEKYRIRRKKIALKAVKIHLTHVASSIPNHLGLSPLILPSIMVGNQVKNMCCHYGAGLMGLGIKLSFRPHGPWGFQNSRNCSKIRQGESCSWMISWSTCMLVDSPTLELDFQVHESNSIASFLGGSQAFTVLI